MGLLNYWSFPSSWLACTILANLQWELWKSNCDSFFHNYWGVCIINCSQLQLPFAITTTVLGIHLMVTLSQHSSKWQMEVGHDPLGVINFVINTSHPPCILWDSQTWSIVHALPPVHISHLHDLPQVQHHLIYSGHLNETVWDGRAKCSQFTTLYIILLLDSTSVPCACCHGSRPPSHLSWFITRYAVTHTYM